MEEQTEIISLDYLTSSFSTEPGLLEELLHLGEQELERILTVLHDFQRTRDFQLVDEHRIFHRLKKCMEFFANKRIEEWGLLKGYCLIWFFGKASTFSEFKLIHRYYYWYFLFDFYDGDNYLPDYYLWQLFLKGESMDFFDVVSEMPTAELIEDHIFEAFKEKGIKYKYYFLYLNSMFEIVTTADEFNWRDQFLTKSFESFDTLLAYLNRFHILLIEELNKLETTKI